MKMSKVGNQTNSQDPQAVNSRVFVGNLNTFQCSKTDVERMFQRYGRIAGISMHKGYAFVQFTNPFDARSACLGEDGRTVLGQILDVNMVAEPKAHQTGRKRQNNAKTGNDWDYYYDSYYASAAFGNAGGGGGGGGHSRLVPPLKRPRLMVPPGGRPILKATPPQKVQMTPVSQLKTYSNPDILICGNCRDMFTDLQELLEHKKSYCKLRFTCKCHVHNGIKPTSECNGNGELAESEAALLCVQCKDSFSSAWDLMVHVQAAHMLNIYELGVPQRRARSSSSSQHEDVDVGNQQLASPQQQPVLVKDSSPSPATPPAPAVVCPVPADKEELEGTSPRAVQDEAPTPGMPEGAVLLDVDDDDLDEMDEDDEEDELLRELRGAASEAASRCRLVNNNVEPPVAKQRQPAPQNCIMRAVRLQNATGDLGALKADVTMLTVADGHQE